jgi:hypothetical protein
MTAMINDAFLSFVTAGSRLTIDYIESNRPQPNGALYVITDQKQYSFIHVQTPGTTSNNPSTVQKNQK